MKKEIIPGDNVSFKTSKYEHEAIIAWLNSQANVTDSIRYLIEQDVAQYGVRNLQEHIPSRRSVSAARRTPAEMPASSRQIVRPERVLRPESPQKEANSEDKPIIKTTSSEASEGDIAASKEVPEGNIESQKSDEKKSTVSQADVDFWNDV